MFEDFIDIFCLDINILDFDMKYAFILILSPINRDVFINEIVFMQNDLDPRPLHFRQAT